ncbi:MAG: NUDIX hydrolase, partial [Planctomycetota bacterium]
MIATLDDMLASYGAADDVERSHLQRMQALLQTSSPCSRHQFEPGHFTASAFVLGERDELLLIHHAKLDRWL